MKLPPAYYLKEDVVEISKNLIGKYIMTCFDGLQTGGWITETEAYKGPEDRASHAYQGRCTRRNQIMYAQGGCIYVYLCRGIHAMLNIVTNIEGIPHAILIRSIEPVEGIEIMEQRRNFHYPLATGPGRVAQALGVNLFKNGISLSKNEIWIEDRGYHPTVVTALPRIGVAYAGADAILPWRFLL